MIYSAKSESDVSDTTLSSSELSPIEESDFRALVHLEQLVEHSPHFKHVMVPHVIRFIAEFSLGAIVHCGCCHQEVHVLPSERRKVHKMHFIHHIYNGAKAEPSCNEHCEEYHCDRCFQHLLQRASPIIQIGDWINDNNDLYCIRQ